MKNRILLSFLLWSVMQGKYLRRDEDQLKIIVLDQEVFQNLEEQPFLQGGPTSFNQRRLGFGQAMFVSLTAMVPAVVATSYIKDLVTENQAVLFTSTMATYFSTAALFIATVRKLLF